MGVIRPPWVSKDWFSQCPFNYCDHFGDKEVLATVCKICKDEPQREKLYKKAGKDPHDLKYVFQDVADSLAQTMKMIQEKAKEMGVDLDNRDDVEEPPPPEKDPIFNLIKKYGDKIDRAIKELYFLPVDTDKYLIEKALDVLSHSRHYIIAKTARALSSRWEEQRDSEDDLFDSKTSAFLAYIAMERNSRAFLTLSKHRPLLELKQEHLKLASLSIKMVDLLKEEFFPQDKLNYSEFGCDSYNEVFT